MAAKTLAGSLIIACFAADLASRISALAEPCTKANHCARLALTIHALRIPPNRRQISQPAMSVSAAKVSTFVRGAPLRVSAPKTKAPRVAVNTVPRAKYGEADQYFDLNDLDNTVGSWDMYGQEDEKRYPGLQNEFFERAGSSLTRREAIRGVLFLGGGAAIALWGAKGAKDATLPITVGPQKGGEKGPKGKL